MQVTGESKKRCKTLQPVQIPEIVKVIIDSQISKNCKRRKKSAINTYEKGFELDVIDGDRFKNSQLKEEIDQIRR